jgi:hypothetical protein
MQIINKKLTDLIPYINNARQHSDAQVLQIAASIKEFGFCNPVLIDGGNGIIAGHGRIMAAQKLGMDEVPTIELAHLSGAQRKAYILADNKLALNADWDESLLAIELAELDALGFDLGLTGFDADELAELLESENPEETSKSGNSSLADRFLVPPFSVLSAREGWWQDRKRQWLALGIKSELGRGGGLLITSEQLTSNNLNFYRDKNKNG